jgi:hypothetical protein
MSPRGEHLNKVGKSEAKSRTLLVTAINALRRVKAKYAETGTVFYVQHLPPWTHMFFIYNPRPDSQAEHAGSSPVSRSMFSVA